MISLLCLKPPVRRAHPAYRLDALGGVLPSGRSGGALPLEKGVLLVMSRFNKILSVDADARIARVQPGVRNLAISEAAAPYGLYYAPDPSSQIACSIGGNVAENSGGPHTLKYGTTTDHIRALELVRADGTVVHIGSKVGPGLGPDLVGAVVGSAAGMTEHFRSDTCDGAWLSKVMPGWHTVNSAHWRSEEGVGAAARARFCNHKLNP